MKINTNYIKSRKTRGGFTIVEIIVVIAILVLIMGAVALFQYNVLDYNRLSHARLENIQDAENILKYMSKEMRAISQSDNGSYPILSAGTSTITFYADVNSDEAMEQVSYYIASTTLYRGIIKPSGSPIVYNPADEEKRIMANGVRNSPSYPLFEYYGSSYSGSGSALTYPMTIYAVRLVKINITLDTDLNKSPLPIVFSTQVSLRNLKDNL